MILSGGCIYKHENCLDMHLAIIKRQYTGPTYGKYKVAYVDSKFRLYAGGTETVKIFHKDLKKWKYVDKI